MRDLAPLSGFELYSRWVTLVSAYGTAAIIYMKEKLSSDWLKEGAVLVELGLGGKDGARGAGVF